MKLSEDFSKRGKYIDLGRWLKEGYRVPTEETPDSELPEVGDGNEGRSGQEG